QRQHLELKDEQLHQLEMERRHLHNLTQELKGNVRVFCRVRPVLPDEQERLELLQFPNDGKSLLLSRPEEGHRGSVSYDFSFDRVFPPKASQQEVFEEISLLVQVEPQKP
ncbi:CTK2 protein, partial [Upupa epops]|nr:CTK2 protein [Upupa epops]